MTSTNVSAVESAADIKDLKRLPNNAIVYRTTKQIENPIGDGRHNRADWRPEFDKNSVAAGTLFGVDDSGNLFEVSRVVRFVPAAKAAKLRDRLMEVASEPLKVELEEQSLVDIAAAHGGSDLVLRKVLEIAGIPTGKLESLLAAIDQAEEDAKVKVVSRAPQAAAAFNR